MSGEIVLALRLIAALALYSFLGWALYTLWQDVKKQGRSLANRRVTGISLSVHRESETPVQKYFFQSEIILGRDPVCDLFLDDDTVSTRHAQLSYHHNQWWLTDLNSTNGTLLNETRVNMPTVITSGDEIACGSAQIFVIISPDTVVPPTQKVER